MDPISGGIFPVRLLPPRPSIWRLLRRPTLAGMGPDSEHREQSLGAAKKPLGREVNILGKTLSEKHEPRFATNGT